MRMKRNWLPAVQGMYLAAPKQGSGDAKLPPKCSHLVHRPHLFARPFLPLGSEAWGFCGVSKGHVLAAPSSLGKQHDLVQGGNRFNGRLGGSAELFNSLSHEKKLLDLVVHGRSKLVHGRN